MRKYIAFLSNGISWHHSQRNINETLIKQNRDYWFYYLKKKEANWHNIDSFCATDEIVSSGLSLSYKYLNISITNKTLLVFVSCFTYLSVF